MFSIRTLLFSFLALLITATFSAPISAPSYSTNTLTTHPIHASLEKKSPNLFSSDRLPSPRVAKRSPPEYSPLVAHDESAVPDARSSDDISDTFLEKRTEGSIRVTLVKRKSIAKKIRAAFHKAGTKIKSGFQKAGKAIKTVAQKVGKGVKKAAQKVGKFIKTTGAKVVKFGLKVYATATKVASKVAKFIPRVGKAISARLDAVSRVTNLVSDKIPVKLGKKLDKGMRVMNRIQHPISKHPSTKGYTMLTSASGVTGKVLENVFKRDTEEIEHFYERSSFVGALRTRLV